MTSTTLYLPSCLRTATSLRGRRYGGLHSPSIFIAWTRLVLMRLNDPARIAISSLPLLVGDPRQPGDGPYHDGMKHEVEGDENESEDSGERDHENLEGVVGALDGQGHGDGDD